MSGTYPTPAYSGSFKETIEGGAAVRIPSDAAAQRMDSTYISRIYNTSSATSSCFGGAETQIDFVITPSAINVFTEQYLSMRITNTSGKPITVLPTFFWFDRIELQISGQPVETYYPSDMFQTWLAVNPSEKVQVQAPFCAYDTYAAPFVAHSIGTGGTGEFILPMSNLSFLTQGVLNDAIRSEIRLRFYQAPLFNCVPSGQTAISLRMDQMQLYGGGISLAATTLAQARRNWASFKHVFPGVNTQVKTINVGTTSAGVLSGYEVLNAAQGMYSGLMVWATDLTGFVPEDRLTPNDLAQVVLYDVGQAQINFETSTVELNYLQANTFPLSETNIAGASTVGFYYIPFSTHFRSSLIQLCNHGCRRLVGTESIRVATAAGLTNCQLTIYLYQLSQFTIDVNGSVTFAVRI